MSKEAARSIGIGLLTFGIGTLVSGTAGLAIRAIGTNIALSGASQALAATPGRAAKFQSKGNPISPTAALPIIFGKTRVDGPMAFVGVTGTDQRDLHYAVGFSASHAGGCGGVTDLYLDGRKIAEANIDWAGTGEVSTGDFATFVNGRRYAGTSTQTVDTTLDTAFASWASTAYGRYICYAALRFRFDKAADQAFQKAFPGGRFPMVEATVKGVKVYDPRLDSTNGGAGAHRYTDPLTWEYTNGGTDIGANPALQAATYLMMARNVGGWGLDGSTDIDWTSVATAANDCATTITVPNGSGGSTTIAKYTGNLAVDTLRNKWDNLQLICSSMLGRAVVVGNKIKIYAGAYTTPATTITETWLAEGKIVRRPKVPVNRVYNFVKCAYRRADNDYNEDVCNPFTSSAYETADSNRRLPKEISGVGIDHEYRAQYVCNVIGRRSREMDTLILPCNAKALDVEPWEIVTLNITLPSGRALTGTWRIVALEEWDGGGASLTLQPESSALWASTYPTDYTERNAPSAPSLTEETPPLPTNFAATGTATGIDLTWDPLNVQHQLYVLLYRSTTSGGTFSLIRSTDGKATVCSDVFTTRTTYYYKIKVRDARGNLSAYSSEVTATGGSLDQVADGATYGKILGSELSSGAHKLTVAGSNVRTADARNVNQIFASNSGATLSAQPLTAADVGATATITVAAFTLYIGSLSVAYNSGSITGLSFSTVYYVYCDDANLAGGTVTFSATTSRLTPSQANARIYLGKITTPADGAGGTGGSGGGGSECVAAGAYLTNGHQASAAGDGDLALVLDGDGFTLQACLGAGRLVDADCVTLTTESGIRLTVSAETPVPTGPQTFAAARDMLGRSVAVIDGREFRWEAVDGVEPVGRKMVRRLSFGGRSFAAGDQRGRFILTHNVEKP